MAAKLTPDLMLVVKLLETHFSEAELRRLAVAVFGTGSVAMPGGTASASVLAMELAQMAERRRLCPELLLEMLKAREMLRSEIQAAFGESDEHGHANAMETIAAELSATLRTTSLILPLRQRMVAHCLSATGGVPSILNTYINRLLNQEFLVRGDDGRFNLSPQSYFDLQIDVLLSSPVRGGLAALPRAMAARDLLEWLVLQGSPADLSVVAQARRRTVADDGPVVEMLIREHWVERYSCADGDMVVFKPDLGLPLTVSETEVRAKHSALAEVWRERLTNKPGDQSSLRGFYRHAVLAAEDSKILEATFHLAKHNMVSGTPMMAVEVIRVGLKSIGTKTEAGSADGGVDAILYLMGIAALSDPTGVMLGAWETALLSYDTVPGQPAMLRLAQAAIAHGQGKIADARDKLPSPDLLPDLTLASFTWFYAVLLAQKRSHSHARRVLREAKHWFLARQHSPEIWSRFLRMSAMQRYHDGDYEASASMHFDAACQSPYLHQRVGAILSGASAYLEMGLYPLARERARHGLRLAQSALHMTYAIRALRLIADIDYRSWCRDWERSREGVIRTADEVLLNEFEHLGLTSQFPEVLLTEGAFAWRHGDLSKAFELAKRATVVYEHAGMPVHAVLARGLRAAAEGGVTADDYLAAGVHDSSAVSTTEALLLTQGIGLMWKASGDYYFLGRARAFASRIPLAHHCVPLSVISIQDATGESETCRRSVQTKNSGESSCSAN